MTERDHLRAIESAPSDHAPRLAYAAWLDDAGQHAEAEWVRLDVLLATANPFPPHEQYQRHRQLRGPRGVTPLWLALAREQRRGEEWDRLLGQLERIGTGQFSD